MNAKNVIANLKQKLQGPTGESRDAIASAKNWYSDRCETLEVQRSILLVLLTLAVGAIVFLAFSLSFVKATKSIEPFVIEIEPKSGVATVVTPLDSKVYSEEEAIRRFFVWRYIKAREEYNFQLYDYNYSIIELQSAPEVFGQYARSVRRGVKTSPIESLGEQGSIAIELKSMTFIANSGQGDVTAQVRFKSNVYTSNVGSTNMVGGDYIVNLTFRFDNSKLNDKQRFENPLGFTVKQYIRETEYSG